MVSTSSGNRLYVATGNVRLSFNDVVLAADKIVLDRDDSTVRAEGHVRVWKGKLILEGDSAFIHLEKLTGQVRHAKLVVMRRKVPPPLRAKKGTGQKNAAGGIEIEVRGRTITKGEGNEFGVKKGFFTPCRCPGNETPSWRIECVKAEGEIGEGAWMTLPVFYVKDVPFFYLPALYMPLKDRKTGLLWPRLAYIPKAGWEIGESFYMALRRDLDLTLDADVFTGRGVRGGVELRYALTHDFYGTWHATYLYDWTVDNEEKSPHWTKIHRFTVEVEHRQRLFGDWNLELHLELLGDRNTATYFRDSLERREAEFTESGLTLGRSAENWFAGIQFTYFQDLKTSGPLFGELSSDPLVLGPKMIEATRSRSDATVQRLPRLVFEVMPSRLGGLPLYFEAEAGLEKRTRFGPSTVKWEKTGTEVVPLDDNSVLGKLWMPGRVSSDTRMLLDARLAAPLSTGAGAFGIEPYLRAAQVLTVMDTDVPGGYSSRFIMDSGATVSSSLYRVFGHGSNIRFKHLIRPFVSYRYRVLDRVNKGNDFKGMVLDLYDRVQPFHRLLVGVANRLVRATGSSRSGARYDKILDLELTQAIDISREFDGKLMGPSRAELKVFLGYFNMDLDIGVSPGELELQEILGRMSLKWPGRFQSSLWYDYLAKGAGYRFGGWEANPGKIHEVNLSTMFEIVHGLRTGFNMRYRITDGTMLTTGASLFYTSPCSCWSLGFRATMYPSERAPRIQFLLDLSRLGSFGG